jgi:hypothetical protein
MIPEPDPRRIVDLGGGDVPTPEEIQAAILQRELELIGEDQDAAS